VEVFAAITCQEETVAEIRIEEKKRGAPWLLIIVLLVVAAIIGWFLWSNRTSGEPTTNPSSEAVADSVATPPPTP
jgi:predicted negative regulator of RcsB-dependent stress response